RGSVGGGSRLRSHRHPQQQGARLLCRGQTRQEAPVQKGGFMKETDCLVDSAAYIDLMRAGEDPRQVLAPLLRSGRLYNCGVVRAEVLRGIRIEKHYAQMEQFFDI